MSNYYNHNAKQLFDKYQSLDSGKVHASWLKHLPQKPGLVLDVGGGSGRDAAWLSQRGWDVIVVEPATALFELGQIVGTPGALQELQEAEQNPLELIFRHVTGDWGNLCEEDREENEFSLARGLRILSAYELDTGKKIWVITEHDRSVTTILRPIDY